MKSNESIICVIVLALVYVSILCNCRAAVDIDNASPTDFVGDAFNKLSPGWIVYTVPNETKVGNGELVEVRIARNITEDLYKDLRGRGFPELGKIQRIGTRMRPYLRAENESAFTINAQFPDIAADRPIIDNFTEWDWDITPLVSGSQKLKLDVYTVLEIPPYSPYYYPYPVFEKTIIVDVNPLYTTQPFLWANYQWIIGLIGSIAAFFIGRYTKGN